MKKLSFIVLLIFIFQQVSYSQQAIPGYIITPAHPAYNQAALSAPYGDPTEFIRGFCFAWDGGKPLYMNECGGQIVTIDTHASLFSNPLFSLGGNFSTNTTGYHLKLAYSNCVTINWGELSQYYYTSYTGVSSFASGLPAGMEKDFWDGYAACMLQASGNPNIFLINPRENF
ncbi:MAG: hypothetical protein JNJ86_13985 [Chitinophagaceae bacterium]|nr:hypothetical protein [Chitinophagaceae bacterium]